MCDIKKAMHTVDELSLQCVATYCSVLQFAVVCCIKKAMHTVDELSFQCVASCCGVLHQKGNVHRRRCIDRRCSVLQCVVVCCNVPRAVV